ncbi:MAG: ACT domain-containing protein [Nitrososphaeria archaeon]|nr:ACT domain-containing protein [Nitrososphaeria archaeon]
MITMMENLQHRGKDSAGVAVYGREGVQDDEYIIKIFTKDVVGALSKVSTALASAGADIRSIRINTLRGFGFDKYIVRIHKERLSDVVERINATGLAKVISIGKKMEIIKDIGLAEELEKNFKISEMIGTHGLGHVRFSTESGVDIFHAHPFQSLKYPDIALVHNGQITNYWKIREKLERTGVSFETENDSELIVHYVVEMINKGYSLEEILRNSVKELDGPFSYIISTSDSIGMVRDKLGLRPLLIFEGEKIKAAASEESALRIFGDSGRIRGLRPGEVVCWKRN